MSFLYTSGKMIVDKTIDFIESEKIDELRNSIKTKNILTELKDNIEKLSLEYKDKDIKLLSSDFDNFLNTYFDIAKIFNEKIYSTKHPIEDREAHIKKQIDERYDGETRCIVLSYFKKFFEIFDKAIDEIIKTNPIELQALFSRLNEGQRKNTNKIIEEQNKNTERIISEIKRESKTSPKPDYFIRSKEQYERMHSSRFQYIEIDESLFADAAPEKDDAKSKQFDVVVKDSDQQAKPLLETVNTCNGNFIFIGEGGAGKTTSLLQIWKDWLEKEELPLYVPLNEYDGVKDKFIETYVEKWYGLNFDKIDNPIILLLDGFNEIRGDSGKILKEIKDLGSWQNIRIVLTSRHNFINFFGFNDKFFAYEIQPLSADVILKFLEKTGLPVVDNWEELLSTPMMLTLYANTCAIQKNAAAEKLFPFKPSKSRGEIIYNYLLCQLAKLLPNEQVENLYSAYIALFGVAPYIAWRMETEWLFSISDKDCNCIIEDYLSKNGSLIKDKANEFLKSVAFKYCCDWKNTHNPLHVLTHLFHILEREIFGDNEAKFSFIHQHFRDFLAAMHITNVINDALQNEPFVLPAEVSDHSWSVYVRNMIADYYGDYWHREDYNLQKPTPLHRLLGKLRGLPAKETGKAVHNIIETWRSARGGRIAGEDLTRLDLSNVPMNGIWFTSHDAASVFDGSFISEITLLPQGHFDSVNSAVYSSDGQRVVSTSLDNTVKEWDRETGQCLRTFAGHSRAVTSAVYSPAGNRVLSASTDINIKEWDRENGQCLRTFVGHSGAVTSAVYSPDGRRVLSASGDKTIKEWDRENGQCLRTFVGHSGAVTSAVYSPDDGRRVLSASWDTTIKEWDRETGKCLRTFKGHSKPVHSAVYSPDDGRRVLSAARDKKIKEWDRETGQCLRTFAGHLDVLSGAVCRPDGRRVLSVSWDKTIKEWDRETGQCLRTLEGHLDSVFNTVYSPDGRRMLSVSSDDTIDDNTIDYKTIKEWDRETRQCLRTFVGHSSHVISAVYSHDGRRVLSASEDDTIKEWDRETGQCLQTFVGHSSYVSSAVYSHDGRRVLSASSDETKEWDRETGQCLRTFAGHLDIVNSAVYSPDGRRVLSASADKTIKEWDRETGQCLRTFVGHSDWVNSAAYSPDGRRVLSASEGETIKEWDRKTGQCLRTFEDYEGSVRNAAYSPDGRRILSVFDDNTINEWDGETGEYLWTCPPYGGVFITGCGFKDCKFSSDLIRKLIRVYGGKL
jgi:WD40 repeat protein